MSESKLPESTIPLAKLSSWHLDFAVATAEKWPVIFTVPAMMEMQIFVAKNNKENTITHGFSPTRYSAVRDPILAREALNGLSITAPASNGEPFEANYGSGTPSSFGETSEIAGLRAYVVKALSPKSVLTDRTNSAAKQATPIEIS